ncbi:MAG: phosphoglycerate mutase family protein [Saprospiraceae bacterium]
MKKLVVLALFSLVACTSTRTIFIVRHAEKIDDSRDPDLSETGQLRAQKLAKILADKSIQEIFSTDYKRTRQTANPLAQLNGITIQIYKPDTLDLFVKRIVKSEKNVLVVGHSNSTLSLLDAMGLAHTIKKIDETDYSNLFIVRLKGSRPKMSLEESKF